MKRRRVIRRGIDISSEARERALLVTVEAKRGADRWSAEASLKELARLAGTAGAEVVGKLSLRLPVPS